MRTILKFVYLMPFFALVACGDGKMKGPDNATSKQNNNPASTKGASGESPEECYARRYIEARNEAVENFKEEGKTDEEIDEMGKWSWCSWECGNYSKRIVALRTIKEQSFKDYNYSPKIKTTACKKNNNKADN